MPISRPPRSIDELARDVAREVDVVRGEIRRIPKRYHTEHFSFDTVTTATELFVTFGSFTNEQTSMLMECLWKVPFGGVIRGLHCDIESNPGATTVAMYDNVGTTLDSRDVAASAYPVGVNSAFEIDIDLAISREAGSRIAVSFTFTTAPQRVVGYLALEAA